MKINPISQNYALPVNKSYSKDSSSRYYTHPQSAGNVSFKSGVTEVLVALRLGSKGVSNAAKLMKKWRFGRDMENRIANPKTSDNCKQLADTLTALANIPKGYKTPWLCDSVEDWYKGALKIVHLADNVSNDVNGVHTAKAAFLTHLVDTGYFVSSNEFHSVFNTLPASYKRDKEYMIEKMFKESGIVSNLAADIGWEEAIRADGAYDLDSGMAYGIQPARKEHVRRNWDRFKNEASDEIAIAATALVSQLDKKEHNVFLSEYRDYIEANKSRAQKYIMDNRTSSKDDFFKYYANNYWKNSYHKVAAKSCIDEQMQASYKNSVIKKFNVNEELAKKLINYYIGTTQNFNFLDLMHGIHSDKAAVMRKFNVNGKYAEGLIKDYNSIKAVTQKYNFFKIMKNLHPDKETIMQKFNICEEFADELIKDYELISATANNKNSDEVRRLFAKRIEEKHKNASSDIQDSAEGLVELSGRKNELKALLEKPEIKSDTETNLKKNNSTDSSYLEDSDDLEYWERAELMTPWIVP